MSYRGANIRNKTKRDVLLFLRIADGADERPRRVVSRKRSAFRSAAQEKFEKNIETEQNFRATHRDTPGWGIRRTERAIEAGMHLLVPSAHQRKLQRRWGFLKS